MPELGINVNALSGYVSREDACGAPDASVPAGEADSHSAHAHPQGEGHDQEQQVRGQQ